ncbi:hypothetical protein E2C01_010211 [Portunus trituberculatus]|uniref:Uncharacterized protein n=1 Tax=Portunus trituberculatus TaxID=210409 RepID=A0A5B7D7U6_PORTR|nr:hypothetical protein [Portunus trituberculatus]
MTDIGIRCNAVRHEGRVAVRVVANNPPDMLWYAIQRESAWERCGGQSTNGKPADEVVCGENGTNFIIPSPAPVPHELSP